MTINDVRVGDLVLAKDSYASDYTEYVILVNGVELDSDNKVTCYGECLSVNGEPYIDDGFTEELNFVNEDNFLGIAKK